MLPRIDEIIDCLGHAIFFLSKLDLAKGFHQVPIKFEDGPKTAFVMPWGKYQCKYMAFGLWNGPSAFQRLMDSVLHNILYCSHAYIDDIVIYSGSWEDHCVHLIVVLEKLRDVGLTLKDFGFVSVTVYKALRTVKSKQSKPCPYPILNPHFSV